MISEKMEQLGRKRSVIRDIFEYGIRRKQEIGADNVFDFSLGNPSIPAPDAVNETMQRLLAESDSVWLHGYTSAAGDPAVRRTVSDRINAQFNAGAAPEWIYMTCGAAASLTICLTALVNPGDEVIVFAPFFPEYRVFAEKAGASLVVVPPTEPDFQIDFDALIAAITPRTKAVIVNSPNNPTGVVLSRDTLTRLADILTRKQNEFGSTIYLIADEPYRELVYDEIEVPYLPNLYTNTLVCYSYSKSLSLPGERIGYIFVSPRAENADSVYAAVCGAGRALGYVCAPSLLQRTAAACCEMTSDLSAYRRNRDLFYDSLTEMGYTVAHPDGAFYLFVKALEPDAGAFCERAKKQELLLVPSDDFGYPGYIRIAYCVSEKQICDSLPAFRRLIEDYRK